MKVKVSDVVVALVRFAVVVLALIGTQDIWLNGRVDDLLYFTNQSGILLAVVMGWAGVATLLGRPQPPAWLKGGVTLFLAITGLVAYFVLDPEAANAPHVAFGLTSGQIEHQINPVMAVLDFLLFDLHRRMKWRFAWWWLLYLVAFVVFTTIRGIVWDLDYPYGFIDLDELGWGGLLTNVALYGVGFYVLGLLIVLVDHRMPRRALVGHPVDRGAAPESLSRVRDESTAAR